MYVVVLDIVSKVSIHVYVSVGHRIEFDDLSKWQYRICLVVFDVISKFDTSCRNSIRRYSVISKVSGIDISRMCMLLALDIVSNFRYIESIELSVLGS